MTDMSKIKTKTAIISKIDLNNIDINNIKINIPSSKSYLNRALILASMQHGKTILTNVVEICDDVSDMIKALNKIGVKTKIKENKNGKLDIIVFGYGKNFIQPKDKIINCGLGGTTTRFLIGLSALFDFDITITAKGKMLERPINELLEFLQTIGKDVVFLNTKDHLPVLIKNKNKNKKNVKLIQIDGGKSSQFLSSVLMVANALNIDEIEVTNLVSKSYIKITADVLKKFGITLKHHACEDGIKYTFDKNKKYNNKTNNMIQIEQDYSSASYFLALKYLLGIKNKILNIKQKSSQGDAKFVKIIEEIDNYKNKKDKNKPLVLNMKNMPDVSMTAMIICCLQNFNTKITGLKTLKIKECDRLTAMKDELQKIGIATKISSNFDTMTIYGKSNFTLKKHCNIDTYNDHRIAMCFAVLGTIIGNLSIKNADVVNKSFPNFWQELQKFNCVKVM